MSTKPKIVIHDAPSPSEAIVQAAKKAAEVTDVLGRKIRFRKLGAGPKQDLAEIVGPDRIANHLVFTQAFFAYSVTHLDGEEIYPAASYREIRAMIERLDDEGIEAIGNGYVAAFGSPGEQIEASAVKNG